MNYVLGFCIDKDNQVALVLKSRGPRINICKWNGIGGKVEPQEQHADAMCREWTEETGLVSPAWKHIGRMWGDGWRVVLYSARVQHSLVLPARNDVEEVLSVTHVEGVCHPSLASIFAQNIPTIVQHILSGSGILELELV